MTTVAFALLAFSHNLYWGATLVYHFPLAEKVQTNLELIRGSGRLLWLAHYLIILAAIVIAVRRLPTPAAAFLLSIAVSLQAYDLFPSYRNLSQSLALAAQNATDRAQSTTKSPFWGAAATRYREVNFFPITHSPPRYEQVALWAEDHHIAINAASFGRVSVERAFSSGSKLETELTTGTRRTNTLYVIQNRADVDRLVLLPDDGVGEIDGYWVVAPDWFKCATSNGLPALLGRPKTTLASALR